jgi:hypothetical protein
MTSMTAAIAPDRLTTLGVAEASSALNVGGAQTAVWNGQTVDSTSILVRYTFDGDANLDGVINGDDYFRIDSGYSSAATNYADGDLDYNGRINADDYFLIDSNYNKAATPLSVAAAAPLSPGGEQALVGSAYIKPNTFATSTDEPPHKSILDELI